MISHSALIHWRHHAPWETDAQIEQDLVLSRILSEIYSDSYLSERLAFRGGTALQKLFYPKPTRYSEDLDFVQILSEPMGETVNHLREKLDHWLGFPSWKQNYGRFTLFYRFATESEPVTQIRVKIEINTREHFNLYGLQKYPFEIISPWYKQKVIITSYSLEELLATKLRALFQRNKGRDLFDLDKALRTFPALNCENVIHGFTAYLLSADQRVSRAEFEKNLHLKISERRFLQDIAPLLSYDDRIIYDPIAAHKLISEKLITLISGEPWKGI